MGAQQHIAADREAPALIGLGHLANFRGDVEASRRFVARALSAARTAGDLWAEAYALDFQAIDEAENGDVGRCHELARDARSIALRSMSPIAWQPLALATRMIGYHALQAGRLDEAGRWFEEVIDLERKHGYLVGGHPFDGSGRVAGPRGAPRRGTRLDQGGVFAPAGHSRSTWPGVVPADSRHARSRRRPRTASRMATAPVRPCSRVSGQRDRLWSRRCRIATLHLRARRSGSRPSATPQKTGVRRRWRASWRWIQARSHRRSNLSFPRCGGRKSAESATPPHDSSEIIRPNCLAADESALRSTDAVLRPSAASHGPEVRTAPCEAVAHRRTFPYPSASRLSAFGPRWIRPRSDNRLR